MSHAIFVNDLSRHFGAFKAVKNVSFHVERGEIFGYLGANGAGKSTTIRMLIGLLSPTSGSATVAGNDIATASEAVRASIGYMSQKFSLYLDLPVEENVRFFGGAYGLRGSALRERADEILRLTELGDSRRALTGDLPGGIRQRLALGCALLHRPQIVFLDEPTAGVDPVSRRAFWRLIRRVADEGTTVFVTTHYLDEAEYCRRIGLMVDGKLVALDTPAALKKTWAPGIVTVARGHGLLQALPVLRETEGVLAAEPFGAGLHVRSDRELPLQTLLERAGAKGVSLEASEATLEDVFLAVVAS